MRGSLRITDSSFAPTFHRLDSFAVGLEYCVLFPQKKNTLTGYKEAVVRSGLKVHYVLIHLLTKRDVEMDFLADF